MLNAIQLPTVQATSPAPAAECTDEPPEPKRFTCQQQASERKLAGAAKNSFLSRCEKEATERCEAAASERKLAGAARSSNVKKCVNQALGSPS